MHSELKALIELQQVDLKIGELTERVEAIPTEIKALESGLNDFVRGHEERKTLLAANQKERRGLEGEIQLIQEKISKHKDQLYQVKTNEQYKAMLKEIENEESNIRKIEDKVLEKMVEAEELQKRIQEAAAELEEQKSRVASEKARLELAQRVATEQRDQMIGRRKELEALLSEEIRDHYERVRKARKGLGLAEVRDGFCTACNVRLRPQAYNEVRTNEALLTCENCSRILYYVEPPPAESSEPSDEAGCAALQS